MQSSPDYQKAREEALELLDKFGYSSPAVDPKKICEDLGIGVYFAKFSGEDDNISGFFYGERNEIYVNIDEYPRRQTFTIAHELGHKIMHEKWLNSAEYKVLLRTPINNTYDPKEKEADTFAANLLVPKFMLDRYYKIASIEELATLFMVSAPVIRNRIKFEYHR